MSSSSCQIQRILNWFDEAKPEPTERDLSVQTGCHFEEIKEMIDTLSGTDPEMQNILGNVRQGLYEISQSLKANEDRIEITNHLKFLDALCDQVVTATGTAKFAGYDFLGSINEVINSNYSKFVDGKAVLNEQGKIAKGPAYFKPNLQQYLNI